MVKLNIDGIPEELKKDRKWVGFKIGEQGKKPIDPKSIGGFITYASISDPSTWGTFEEALKLVEAGLCQSIGYANWLCCDSGVSIKVVAGYHSQFFRVSCSICSSFC